VKNVPCGCRATACADQPGDAGAAARYVVGFVEIKERRIPVVSTRLRLRDLLGGWLVRWDVGRASYRVSPGLYAVGTPGVDSPVLVTGNYKLSFDTVRKVLKGIDAWILVLDTKGINVWCAAGKGTFGTEELLNRIAAVRLGELLPRPRLVLPQLSAPGVAAFQVRKATGFPVSFGPVRAADLPAYLAAGFKKSPEMARVEFGLSERMAVAPVELVHALPVAAGMAVVSALLALPLDAHYQARLLATFAPLSGSLLVGSLAFPALLPWLPFRAFSLKGAVLGLAWGVLASLASRASILAGTAIALCVTPLVSFLGMNFTGSSTYTCLTGTELEVRKGLAPMVASLAIGTGLLVLSRFTGNL
jgi:hypothetical protein